MNRAHVSQIKKAWLAAALAASALTGCGGGGGSGNSASSPGSPAADPNQPPSGEPTAKTVTGIFVDAPVQGLEYETATLSGKTNANGEFQYVEGEQVTFTLANKAIRLGTLLGEPTITPRRPCRTVRRSQSECGTGEHDAPVTVPRRKLQSR